MQQYILQRLLLNIPVILLVITVVFLAGNLRPDYAAQVVGQGQASGTIEDYERQLENTRKTLGTDGPLWDRYLRYMGDVLRGDFGTSYLTKHSVTSELGSRLAPSIELGILQIMIALAISIPIGVISAIRQDTWLDYGLRVFAILGLAIPSFFLGTLLLIFSIKVVGWTPPVVNTAYRELWQDPAANLKMLLLPALAGGLAEAAIIVRFLRSQLLEVLRQDFVRTAYAKGLRTVKTCVGSDWCRFGTQDSTGLGIRIEKFMWGSWTPAKVKMAVSGCPRNCAEATCKDVGVICVDSGYEIHFAGAAGLDIKGTEVLGLVRTEDEALEVIVALTQMYREQARYLERIYKWARRIGYGEIRRQVLDDLPRRKEFYDRFVFSQRFAQVDPWSERVSGKDKHEFRPMADLPLQLAAE